MYKNMKPQNTNVNFAASKVKKTFNITIDLLSLSIYAQGPKFCPIDPTFCRQFESELRSGFRPRNGELKGSCVLGSKGGNSPFQCARPKLTSYSESTYPKHHFIHFVAPTGVFERIYRTEQYFGPAQG